jgi:putative DNA primase/helicase
MSDGSPFDGFLSAAHDDHPTRPPIDPTLILLPSAPLDSARAYVDRRHTDAGRRTLLHQNGTFFEWTGTHYVEITPDDIRSRIYDFLDGALRIDEKGERHRFCPNKTKVANVLEATAAVAQLGSHIRAPAWLDGTSDPHPSELVACTNGLLHLPTRRLLPHTPAFYSVNALEFGYHPNAPDPAGWRTFLDQVFDTDQEAINALQEWFGLCLTGDTRHQKALLAVGPKRSGKGTIARVLTQLLGQANVCGPTLSSLGGNFGLEPLIGKRLAIVSDARLSGRVDQAMITERLLSITGEDSLSVDRKFRTAWNGKLEARFMILSNELPRLTDASGALASRFIILRMVHSFYGREDLGLTARLTAELPGILNWAIAGWERLAKRGHFIPPASAAEAQRELEDLGSPISAFLRERCAIEPGAQIKADTLYADWCEWCREQGRDHPGTVQIFGRDLGTAIPGLKITRPRTRGTDDRARVYEGVRLA